MFLFICSILLVFAREILSFWEAISRLNFPHTSGPFAMSNVHLKTTLNGHSSAPNSEQAPVSLLCLSAHSQVLNWLIDLLVPYFIVWPLDLILCGWNLFCYSNYPRLLWTADDWAGHTNIYRIRKLVQTDALSKCRHVRDSRKMVNRADHAYKPQHN